MEAAIQQAAKQMGYVSDRAKQQEAILLFMKGRNVFVSLPTGSGESLCFSILPKAFDIWKKKA